MNHWFKMLFVTKSYNYNLHTLLFEGMQISKNQHGWELYEISSYHSQPCHFWGGICIPQVNKPIGSYHLVHFARDIEVFLNSSRCLETKCACISRSEQKCIPPFILHPVRTNYSLHNLIYVKATDSSRTNEAKFYCVTWCKLYRFTLHNSVHMTWIFPS